MTAIDDVNVSRPPMPAGMAKALADIRLTKHLQQRSLMSDAEKAVFDFDNRDELLALAEAAGMDLEIPLTVPVISTEIQRRQLQAQKAEYEAEVQQYRGVVGTDEEEARERELDERITAIKAALAQSS